MKLFPISHIAAAANSSHVDTVRVLRELGIMPAQSFDSDKRSYRLYDQGAVDAVVHYYEKMRAARKAAKAAKAANPPVAAAQVDTTDLHAKLDEILRHVKRLADELPTVEAQA